MKPGAVPYCNPCVAIRMVVPVPKIISKIGERERERESRFREKKMLMINCKRLSELIQKESSQYCLDTDVTPEVHLEIITFFLADNIEQLLLEWLIRLELVKERFHIGL